MTYWWMDVKFATVIDDDGDKTIVRDKRYSGDEYVETEDEMYHNGVEKFLDDYGLESPPDDLCFEIGSEEEKDEPKDPYERYMLSRGGY